jgi:hydrogenase small subunit
MLSPEFDINAALQSRGFTRRQLVKYCSGLLATLAMPERYLAQTVAAVGKARKPVLVWLQFQDCTGCSESMLRSSHPDVADVVLDLLSWEYHEVIMAGAGGHANDLLDRIVKEEKGKYLVVVEGAIPTAEGGAYCTIGGRSAMEIADKVCRNAAATMAVGACAFDGGLVRSTPNPTGALGVQEAVPGIKVINMAGCPHNPANTAAVVVHYLTFNDLPALDQYNRPLFAYGRVIHDQCERRGHYDAVPLQNGMQRPGRDVQLSSGAVERSHQLAGTRRTRVHRLRLAPLLGPYVAVLRPLARRTRLRGRS